MTNDQGQMTQDKEWWTEQWLDLLNSYRFKKRLERGRIYAREGNVLNIDFEGQKAFARVQGTDPEPYKVSLWLDPLTDEDWNYVIQTMAERAIFSAKLLAGEMPQNIEEVFAANGVRLFPFTLDQVNSRCSCPDKANPCKHIAAVYYLLGDRFSDDPFVLFQLRGRTQSQILAALRQTRGTDTDAEPTDSKAKEHKSKLHKSPLQVEKFWQYDDQLESGLVVIAPAPSSETVLDVLGPIPIKPAATGQAVMQSLTSIYQTVSQQAILSALSRDG
ncbi:SWIM zinc finger family protein [Laspinema olomoucense]|uniref:SWIM zinc finger family protein n=1 Tax=Laspinema olomoucense TaxID=3231600 RepID=UPI0021BAADF0|nr:MULTISPECIES: SWIM zinc finger family protein [unclassified Laspinema]MCT7989936.1 SWIM zinc finger family protein [Laspinema sp. D3a]MCT7995690.1 SWIM zinc finger family protein [Laspinema sp. D3c]